MLKPLLKFCVVVICLSSFLSRPPAAFAQPNSAQTLSKQLLAEPLANLADEAKRFGDPRRGAMAFFLPTMNCARCHEPASGRGLGPDLAEIREVTFEELAQSVLAPSAEIRKGFESALFQLVDGAQRQGILIEETDLHFLVDQIELPEKPMTILKGDVEDWRRTTVSTMPAELVNQLADRQQFLDLLSYLHEISVGGSKRLEELEPSTMMAAIPIPKYESHVDHAELLRSLDKDSLNRGRRTYRLRCASCHGSVDEEGSMPTSLRFATGKFKNGSDPFRMYQTLTHGYGMMNPQHWMVPQQKYEVIHYIRQHFLKPNNPSQFADITDQYLKGLPVGDTLGPRPVVSQPWTEMDYGSSFINTIEVSDDGSNIAQKGITVRLDDGPGGVESGKYWMMYEHDTMRLAGAWSGEFIDYEGIHFSGTHNRHPSVAGEVHFSNPTGPGWGSPSDGSFVDKRLEGRDGKRYGPLSRDWAQYKGMYRFGSQTIIDYTVGSTRVLETPLLKFAGDLPVFQRSINLAARDRELILQIANVDKAAFEKIAIGNSVALLPKDGSSKNAEDSGSQPNDQPDSGIEFDGSTFAQVNDGDAFEMTKSDYTIVGRIKTSRGGSIFSQTTNIDQWRPNGKTLFVKGGRLCFDIGWVGAVSSKRKINDGKWHEIAMTWRAKDAQVAFFVDGKPTGKGELRPKNQVTGQVVRLGFTNLDFPQNSMFQGSLADVAFYQRVLTKDEIVNSKSRNAGDLVASWKKRTGSKIADASGQKNDAVVSASLLGSDRPAGLLASTTLKNAKWDWVDGNLRLKVPAGEAVNFVVSHVPIDEVQQANETAVLLEGLSRPGDLTALTRGGPANWPEKQTTEMVRGKDQGAFAVDVLTRPVENPWNAQLRLTGIDFLPDGNTLVASAWDGSVWKVSGFAESDLTGDKSASLTWQRIAAGLFQPLGIRWIDGKIYVTCRDQLAVLHDLNGDGEIDWYQSLNSDHQVTEHFHEFAMGLQTDTDGNFYYAKSARHALTAVVPHHGTLLKVSPGGQSTQILATGFRAANGVCLNPDGSFVVTDQEGHWNPKNRINWVRPGGFYGNMFGYHDVTDDSDTAMDDPLCWITNKFDRSPSELLWVDSEKWGPLNGTLLNFSYGYGQVHVVPHEEIDGQMQGGMCALPIDAFPTGVMRGRFHPGDGQLYCCGMFAWAGDQQQPGGLYRIRYNGKPAHLPIGLAAKKSGVEVRFSDELDSDSACDPKNFVITVWDLKRTKNYGSKHFNERKLVVASAKLLADGKTVQLVLPDLEPTWGMEIKYSLRSAKGEKFIGTIHNTIHQLAD